MQADDGGSVYLRLSTRPLTQLPRDLSADDTLRRNVLAGGYWHTPPSEATTCDRYIPLHTATPSEATACAIAILGVILAVTDCCHTVTDCCLHRY